MPLIDIVTMRGMVPRIEAHLLPDEAEPVTTLSDSEYAELLRYRQALRDWPTVAGWADNPMPTK